MFFKKNKYEDPDVVDAEEKFERKEKETFTKKDESKIGVTEPYPKKSIEKIEEETDKKIIDVIKNVQDPELGVDIWSLGLIYNIEQNGKLDIVMTFTSPMCPYGPQIVSELKSGLKSKGYKEENLNINVVFNPLWEPSEELKEALGMGG